MESSSPSQLKVTVESGQSEQGQYLFSHSFRIGRHLECSLQIHHEAVSRYHAEVFLQPDGWWIRDLNSANGVFVNGQRVTSAPLSDKALIQLGGNGPSLLITLDTPPSRIPASGSMGPELEAQTIQWTPDQEAPAEKLTEKPDEKNDLHYYKAHYFGNSNGKEADPHAGEHTIMVRRAFAAVQKKQRWTYLAIIGVALALFISAGGLAWYKHRQIIQQRALATEIFYALRSLEVDLVKLNAEAEQLHSQEAKKRIAEARAKKLQLAKSYDRYVESLAVYRSGLSDKERIILRMARKFGECEINMPEGFIEEVNRYIEKWKAARGLTRIVQRAVKNGYPPKIAEVLNAHDLPPQFFYLGVQESHLNHQAVGPPTRFGIAKGMWQFIPSTATRYGLKTGPLADKAVADPQDERHDIAKSTLAAARYLRDIYTTDAQASGLLVMASYNYGERRVIKLLRTLPDNPRERNFWTLISKYRRKIPKQTYDYVFSIFAAAVIGENPPLFGFSFQNPLG